jgi:hypothetical protein
MLDFQYIRRNDCYWAIQLKPRTAHDFAEAAGSVAGTRFEPVTRLARPVMCEGALPKRPGLTAREPHSAIREAGGHCHVNPARSARGPDRVQPKPPSRSAKHAWPPPETA